MVEDRTHRNRKFVIDASFCGIESFNDVFQDIYKNLGDNYFVLTSITVKELDRLQKKDESVARDARYILQVAAEDSLYFKICDIKEDVGSPDDCIIEFCKNTRGSVLLTGDKTMALNARKFKIETWFFSHRRTTEDDDEITLVGTTKIGKKLYLKNYSSSKRMISVISSGIKLEGEIYDLSIGDDVFVSKRKSEFLTFAHYKVISLNQELNCQLVFSRRIYRKNQISVLPKAEYKTFMRRAFKELV